jgi:hypothetical protein
MQASGSHSRGTTAKVKAVDHHDVQVGSWPVAASADQVQGIQGGSGSQAGERIGGLRRHGCGGRRTCCEVKRPRASGGRCTGTSTVVCERDIVTVEEVEVGTRYLADMQARSGVTG